VKKSSFIAKTGRFCLKWVIIFIGHFYTTIKKRKKNKDEEEGKYDDQE
jgi:hypothetical protein